MAYVLSSPPVKLRPACGNFLLLTSKIRGLSVEEIPPNEVSVSGVDLGLARTGLALSKGFNFRPLMVLELRGQKLELRIIDVAQKQEVDEFIIGLPLSSDGRETPQSNKVRSVAGRLAVRASERGWRVYLQEEYGTTIEAMSYMVDRGLGKSAREGKQDAYAAAELERYFLESGRRIELVLPKQLVLQERLKKGCSKDADYFTEESD
ncbi:unnamed protein product [Withania somnifera]